MISTTSLTQDQLISAAVRHRVSSNQRDDIDFYQVDIPANNSAVVALSSIPDELGVSESFNADLLFGANVEGSTSFNDFGELESPPVNSDITMYVRVNKNVGCGNYSISVELSPALLADLNGDGAVDSGDLIAFLGVFPCSENCGPEDLNGDGVINSGDLMLFLANFQG